ncbi:hypothetical protein EJ02DRAFT_95684 [Clathrospora elynae]|uniref:Uncharacterized protein n=1 Tax=Clathrospora elynae TaxID=706981 RepID=A0A6A5T1K4_9PLEO|nr:hypothetical protein EJ02DRAFT_95684 [Clathrospora elynae]
MIRYRMSHKILSVRIRYEDTVYGRLVPASFSVSLELLFTFLASSSIFLTTPSSCSTCSIRHFLLDSISPTYCDELRREQYKWHACLTAGPDVRPPA